MMAWWESLATRERRLVAGAASLLAGTIIWIAAIEPVADHRKSLADGIVAQRALLEWMGTIDTTRRATDGDSLFAIVDRSVRATPLAGAVQRLQPETGVGVRIWLESASFDELVRWIATLERDHGIVVAAFSVERGQGTGSVNARLTLQTT